MSSNITTYTRWPEQLRLKRGLFNGERVQMARECRGIARYALARKVGIAASVLAQREQGWNFWAEMEREKLVRITDFPEAFFVQDDPPTFTGPTFFSGTDENGETWCHVEKGVADE
jgi:transcriptional regulator with XRE-family HTH domain